VVPRGQEGEAQQHVSSVHGFHRPVVGGRRRGFGVVGQRRQVHPARFWQGLLLWLIASGTSYTQAHKIFDIPQAYAAHSFSPFIYESRVLNDIIFVFGFGLEKYGQKIQKLKFQKRYLEVFISIRDKVRAFFQFIPERKNIFCFQMSQKIRLQILRCVVILKGFF
jgi:hypothetical protein